MQRWAWGVVGLTAVTALSGCAASATVPPEPPPMAQETAALPASPTPTPGPTGSSAPERVSGFPPFVLGDGVSVTHADRAEVERPLPITATTITPGVARIVVRYKPFGGVKWESLALVSNDGVFTGEIPCGAMRVAGVLKYYVIASSAEGDPLATVGSNKDPLRTDLTIATDVPLWRLPGKEPSPKCGPEPRLTYPYEDVPQ